MLNESACATTKATMLKTHRTELKTSI
jgi:hypothetical protein